MDLITMTMRLGAEATRREASSALPGAPVVDDRPARIRGTHPLHGRLILARILTRAATAVAPTPAGHPAR